MKKRATFTAKPRPLFDCQTCGACCCTAVELRAGDRVPRNLVRRTADGRWWMDSRTLPCTPTGYRCRALAGDLGACVSCAIYSDRPAVCREVQAGGPMCLSARALFGLEGGKMDPDFLNAAIREALKR